MKALMLNAPHDVQLVDLPVPEPAPDEIRIQVRASGICGTDLHIIEGTFPAKLPLVLGHEFSGVVDAVGADVEGFAVGDRVASDPNLYDGTCDWCLKGAYNLCESWQAVGITLPGALAEYLCIPARFAVHLPDELSFTAGALIEPLSCAIHGFDMGGITGPGTMLLYGAGMMGVATLVLAVRQGFDVTVVETREPRRTRALGLGATAAVAPGEALPAERYDVVVDATGVLPAVADGMQRLRRRGTFLQLGACPHEAVATYSPYEVFAHEWRIIGSFSVADAYVPAAELMPEVADQMEGLVTHRFRLDQFAEAVAAMADPSAVKIHLDPTLDTNSEEFPT